MAPIDDFLRDLSNNRFIKIIVGTGAEQYTLELPETILRSRSKVFDAALRNESWGEGEKGVLRFPEDKPESWKHLAFYLMNLDLANDNPNPLPTKTEKDPRVLAALFYADCWILGDKYDLAQFQDIVMIEYMYTVGGRNLTVSIVQSVFEGTAPDSKLRLYTARAAITSIYHYKIRKLHEFDELGALPSFTSEMTNAFERYNARGGGCEMLDEVDWTLWEEYMVDGGPKKHWIHGSNDDDDEEDSTDDEAMAQ